MVNWALLGRVAVLTSLPSLLLLLYFLSTRSHRTGGDPSQTFSAHSNPSTPVRPLPVRTPWPRDEAEQERLVLVTGSAGFIGYHVSHALVEQWGASVVGLDNFNNYYDVQLKRDRANELIKLGVRQYQGDVCDSTLLSHLFSKYAFTDVVHLAAQAGVRHSLEEPLSYVQANVQCFLTLLDQLADQKAISNPPPRLVFASSSSVYGSGADLPFSISSPPSSPASIYAASKMANEQFAESYCAQHGLPTIGLRFFTVYGPWGRPDMAVYKFAHRMAKGLPVPWFNSPDQPVVRDFTFINDTVGGVLAALNHAPTRCGEVYNVGAGRPSTLKAMLNYLQEEMNLSAKIELLPLPPSDLHSTYADISQTTEAIGYHPSVSLKEGIREFVQWFTWYSKKKKKRREQSEGERNDALEEALAAGEREMAAVYRRELEHTNTVYRERIKALKKRYFDFARENGREALNLKKTDFTFYPGVDSPGGTVIQAPGYRGNIELLKDRCLKTEQCIAFNTKTELKNTLLPQHMWTRTDEGEGLYVANINMCESDLHDCGRHAQCVHTGPASYSCNCEPGYVRLGRQCVEKYSEGRLGNGEWAWQLSDHLDGLNWDKLTGGGDFVFVQGLDSPGGDYMVVEGGAGNVDWLKGVCHSTHHCLAFNTNGILKHSLSPPSKWMRWTDHPQHGLYVRDIDYCSLDLEECPAHSSCARNAPGNYSCACRPYFEMGRDGSCTRRQLNRERDTIHVIISVDRTHFPGLVGVVNSALSHASQPERLKFHIVLSDIDDESVLWSYLRCYGYDNHAQLEVTKLNTDWLRGRVKVYTDSEKVGNLASLANFGRFLFHEHFPHLSRAIYLDADTLVLGDVGEFWDKLSATSQTALAVPRKSPSYGSVFGKRVKEKFQERYGFTFKDSDPTFNAGVYGVNFDLWRSKHLHEEVQYWLEEQAEEHLWEFGTQPVMLLVLYSQWEELGVEWNVDGLGWKRNVDENVLTSAKLLHWNGKGKPWLGEGLHHDLWMPHLPEECSGRGSCVYDEEGSSYSCRCSEEFTGSKCQTKLRHKDTLSLL